MLVCTLCWPTQWNQLNAITMELVQFLQSHWKPFNSKSSLGSVIKQILISGSANYVSNLNQKHQLTTTDAHRFQSSLDWTSAISRDHGFPSDPQHSALTSWVLSRPLVCRDQGTCKCFYKNFPELGKEDTVLEGKDTEGNT